TNGITLGQVSGNGGSPWQSFLSNSNVFLNLTNALFATNAVAGTSPISQGIRPGVNKLLFKRVNFDSLLGQTLVPVTNLFTDTVITNGRVVIQPLQRVSNQPDILFLVQDLGLNLGVPVAFARSTTAGWQNNDLINGFSNLGGPGVITPQVQVFFSDVLPFFLNGNPFSLDDITAASSFIWASFDGSTN